LKLFVHNSQPAEDDGGHAPMERRNKRTGKTEKARIWTITVRTIRTWLGETVDATAADDMTFPLPVKPHSFRHGYAIHMLYAGIPSDGA
jgi:integrase